jgi:hypothetical protein
LFPCGWYHKVFELICILDSETVGVGFRSGAYQKSLCKPTPGIYQSAFFLGVVDRGIVIFSSYAEHPWFGICRAGFKGGFHQKFFSKPAPTRIYQQHFFWVSDRVLVIPMRSAVNP